MVLADIPLLITFAAGARLQREAPRVSQFRILGNGPAGTFVLFPHLALRVSLPTDQVVYSADSADSADSPGSPGSPGGPGSPGSNVADERHDGRVRVGFGGMAFRGEASGQLVFDRIRELHPEEQLSPDRSHVMRLDVAWVHELRSRGEVVWRATG